MPSEKKNVLVGIRIDGQSRDLLSWALVKVAEPGDCVVAVHVSRSSDRSLGEKLLLEGYLEVYEGLCSVKQIDLKGKIFKGRSTRRVLIREAKNHAAVALVLGVGKHSALGGWTSTARYCAKRLPTTTNVLAINNGKIVFRRPNNNQLPGLKGDPRPSFYKMEQHPAAAREWQSEYGDSEVMSEISIFEGVQSTRDGSRTSNEDSKSEILSEGRTSSSRSLCLFAGDCMDYKPGWPLLLRASSATPQAKHARSLSVVKWVMNLPIRSPYHTPTCSTIKEDLFETDELSCSEDDDNNSSNSSMENELQKCLELLLKTNSSDCQWFSYRVLKSATAHFSSDNDLISVYDFSSKGSLEEILHGKNNEKHPLSWEVRYNVAVGIAEGLNYLHNEHPRPVIHRDVKSSNILLSDGFEPKLSDFGLAIWGPIDSSFLTQADVVGTFGYLAPEYFMYGKLSDKIDVYAFGVILLELLSGKRPISFETAKGQQSLVMWQGFASHGQLGSVLG
ncbi:hypothetical protein COLO4_17332 [Corchorus olitorius]|uniref:non-specific serine/threonine protein kinase n=1 Tax=Corchorus olitorius TaxID=93759 RepID=A0A1R3JD79_9ROSI|nr:hypothetical protein COLO4_17332 [Corchorus olitorius]